MDKVRSASSAPKDDISREFPRSRCSRFGRGRGVHHSRRGWCSRGGPRSSGRTETPRVVHFSVFCDGCGKDEEAKAQSLSKGCYDPRTGYIVGVRYKSAVAEDFDLCASCEGKDEFIAQEPFLKINNPSKAPKGIMCVLAEEDQESNIRRGPRLGIRPVRACRGGLPNPREFRSMVRSNESRTEQPNRTFVEKVVNENSVNNVLYSDATKGNVPVAKEVNSIQRCPQNHPLGKHVTRDLRYICDKCNKRIGRAQEVYGCRACDWDICTQCKDVIQRERQAAPEAKPTVSPPVSATPARATPNAPFASQQQPWHASSNPQAKFLSITSLPDGSVVNPGQQVTKGWKVQNSGSSPWPAGARMVCVGGDRMGGPFDGVQLPCAAPGTTVHIKLPLRAPSRPGRYVGYWRFITAQNHRFGHRFWVDLSVRGSAQQQVVSSVMAPINTALDSVWNTPTISATTTEEPSVKPESRKQDMVSLRRRFSEELTQLANMGFCDLDRNAMLLQKHQGRVDLVLSELVDKSMDDEFLQVVDRGL